MNYLNRYAYGQVRGVWRRCVLVILLILPVTLGIAQYKQETITGGRPYLFTNVLLEESEATSLEGVRERFLNFVSGQECQDVQFFSTEPVAQEELMKFGESSVARAKHGALLDFLKWLSIENAKPTSLEIEQHLLGSWDSYHEGLLQALSTAEKSAPEASVRVLMLGGAASRTAAVYAYPNGSVALLFGVDLVREQTVNYLYHLIGNLAGVEPIWGGDKDACDHDNVEDTPQHSAANYDTSAHHVSSCTWGYELDANYMDARYGKESYSWTPGQLSFFDDWLEKPLRRCDEVSSDQRFAACGLLTSPTLTAYQLESSTPIRLSALNEEGPKAISLAVYSTLALRWQKTELQLPAALKAEEFYSGPGQYTLVATTPLGVCRETMILSN